MPAGLPLPVSVILGVWTPTNGFTLSIVTLPAGPITCHGEDFAPTASKNLRSWSISAEMPPLMHRPRCSMNWP